MSEQLIYKKMADIMQDIEPIAKTQRNEKQKWMFRGIDDVMNSLHKLFAKHRVITIPETIDYKTNDRKDYKDATTLHSVVNLGVRFYAEDGSNVLSNPLGESIDYGDKSINQSISIAYKTCLLLTFCIHTQDLLDPDNKRPEAGKKKDYTCMEKLKGELQKAKTIEYIDKIVDTWDSWASENKIKAEEHSDGINLIHEKRKELNI